MKNKIVGEEKHYQKLNLKLQQELRILKFQFEETIRSNRDKIMQISKMADNIYTLEKENKFLKEHLNLSDEDLQKLLRGSKALDGLVGALGLLNNRY